ncbi:MAG: Ku protein [Geminicoccaceae bacterium]
MAPRAYWKGHVRLSLVAFPVQLFSAATAGSRVSFHQIHRPSGQRVRYQKTVPGVGPVDKDEIVKGYEVAKDSYVTFADDELEAIRIESQHTIDLVQFVGACEIDPLYYDKPYFLVPDGKVAQEAFRVIRQALQDTGQVGLGQVVLSGRESFVALKPCGKGMLLETLRTAQEVRKDTPYFAEIEDGPLDQDQLTLARQLIERKTARFDPARFVDQYEAALRELIEAKAKGKRITVERGPVATQGQVVDLMAALKKSLSEERPSRANGPAEVRDHPRKAAAKAKAASPAPAKGARPSRVKRAPGPKQPRQPADGRKSA